MFFSLFLELTGKSYRFELFSHTVVVVVSLCFFFCSTGSAAVPNRIDSRNCARHRCTEKLQCPLGNQLVVAIVPFAFGNNDDDDIPR